MLTKKFLMLILAVCGVLKDERGVHCTCGEA